MLSQTSKMVLGIIEDHLNKGDVKGLKEYGQPIEEASDILYNWQLMAMEEMADCMKYQQMEINKLKSENILLKTKNWFSVYEENLKLAKENKELKEENVNMRSKFNASIRGILNSVYGKYGVK